MTTNNTYTYTYNINVERLLGMMRLTRRHGSEGEWQFLERYILPMNPKIFAAPSSTAAAYVVEVLNEKGERPPVLFSAHTDTVHSDKAPTTQEVIHEEESGYVYKTDGMPLGADNAAGCAVLLHMIERGVPGAYIFHRGEEVGGIGSSAMAEHHADWLKQFKWAIAFDRKGTDSVITEMMVGDTASNEFAEDLSSKLNGDRNQTKFSYAPDNTGTFTDTANYAHIIPECTNVSVGYAYEHSKDEILDLMHLDALAVRLVEIFKHGVDLPVKRVPHEPRSFGNWGSWGTEFTMSAYTAKDILGMGYKEVVDFVRTSSAHDVADMLYDLADRIAELEEYAEEDKVKFGAGPDMEEDHEDYESYEPFEQNNFYIE